MILSDSWSYSSCLTIFYLVLIQDIFTHTSNMRLHYSYSIHDYDWTGFKLFAGVSIKECKSECEQRPVCKALVYRRQPLSCYLLSAISEASIVKQNGSILMTEFGANSETNSTNETEAFITECEILQGNFDVYGNMNDVDSTIMIDGKSNGKDLLLTCDETGSWIPRKNDISNDMTTTSFVGDCSDVTGPSGIYWDPNTNSPIFCDMETDSGGWLVFQRREDGSVDFQRNWKNYTSGFGSIDGEFWMGLLPLYRILAADMYELRIDMIAFDGTKGYANYNTFSIGPPERNFILHVSGYTGNVGDSLDNHNGMEFSTFDKDNDRQPRGSCAGAYGGGWWFGACYHVNLNGVYVHCKSTCPSTYNIDWVAWVGRPHTIQRTEMKTRRLG